eukprot:3744967-Rhodomonas_salina.3
MPGTNTGYAAMGCPVLRYAVVPPGVNGSHADWHSVHTNPGASPDLMPSAAFSVQFAPFEFDFAAESNRVWYEGN